MAKSMWSRRQFLDFMAKSSVLAGATTFGGCASPNSSSKPRLDQLSFKPLRPSVRDELIVAEGFSFHRILTWGDFINEKGEKFGFNNDYLNWVPLNSEEIILWVNHESVDPLLIHGTVDPQKKSKAQISLEMQNVGGSLVHLKKNNEDWKLVTNSPYNRRIDGHTLIPFSGGQRILGKSTALGTLANCAGGKTPTDLILTCEENYDIFYGENHTSGNKKIWSPGSFDCGWYRFFKQPPEHYGWVVEVNPLNGHCRKLLGLGRFAHESATVTLAKDGRWVVYSGDDAPNRCLYKFISSTPGQLDEGILYVANTEQGRWLPLHLELSPILKKYFRDHLDLLIHTRQAAELVGGTPLDRPEDVEIDPATGNVIVALTNNKAKGNLHGSLLKIEELNADAGSLDFSATTFALGGEKHGFSCPDNLAFDRRGNLWITSDISGSSMNKGEYLPFGNNGLFFIPLHGANAGFAFQVASAPRDAELTGPSFSPDGRSLFLSVQHPGEMSHSLDQLNSHWPLGGTSIPRPAVVEIKGPF